MKVIFLDHDGVICLYDNWGSRLKKQKDIRNKKESSLEIVYKMFEDEPEFGCVSLNNPDEIVRNKIIKIIEQKFDDYEEKKGKL